jgi:hypothetical protein
MTMPNIDLDLAAVAEALNKIGTHLKYLGVGDAGTTMGAMEFLAVKNYEGAQLIAGALESLADAVRNVDMHCTKCCMNCEKE